MNEQTVNILWTNPTNTLIKCKVGEDTIRIGVQDGRLYAEKKNGQQIERLELSGMNSAFQVQTLEQKKQVCRTWKQSTIQLQGNLLSILPRVDAGLNGPIPTEHFPDPEALRNHSSTELNLANRQLTAAKLTVLMQTLPDIVTTLILDGNKLDLDAITTLSNYLPSTKLTSLSLRSCKIDESGMAILAPALARSPLLTHLNLYRNKIGKVGVQCLAQYLPLSSIADLNLHRCYIDLKDIQNLLKTLPLTKISMIDLGWNELGDPGAITLGEVISNNPQFASQLKVIRLQSSGIGHEGAIKLAEALLVSQIEELDLSMNNIKDNGAIAIAALLANTPMVKLVLSWNEIGKQGTEALFRYLSKSPLNHLDITGNTLGERGAKALGKVLPNSQLKELVVGTCELGDKGTALLAQAILHSQVLYLDLHENQITPDGAQKIAEILHLCPLEQLFLQKNMIEDQGMESLGLAMPSSAIKMLDVRNNGIQNVGAFFKNAARSPLTSLYLDENLIGDDTVEDFAPFLTEPRSQLSVLTLRKNAITSTGALNFLSVVSNSNLSSLQLEGNPIDPAQLDTLNLQIKIGNEKRKKLFKAIRDGDLQEVKQLLKRNSLVNSKDELGNTPLHLSVHNINILRFLLNYKPINSCNNQHKFPIEIAREYFLNSVVRLLENMVVVPEEYFCPILGTLVADPVTARDGKTYERAAIEKYFANTHPSRILTSPFHGGRLENRILIPNHTIKGQVLELAALHPELYRQLHLPVEIKANFIMAIDKQNLAELRYLLSKHKQLLFSPVEDELPIQRACQTSIEILEIIIKAYPESLRPSLTFELCAQAAEHLGREGVELLFERLPKSPLFNLRDLWFEAINRSATALVGILIDMGAQRQAKNKQGVTAFELAKQKGSKPVIELLTNAPGLSQN